MMMMMMIVAIAAGQRAGARRGTHETSTPPQWPLRKGGRRGKGNEVGRLRTAKAEAPAWHRLYRVRPGCLHCKTLASEPRLSLSRPPLRPRRRSSYKQAWRRAHPFRKEPLLVWLRGEALGYSCFHVVPCSGRWGQRAWAHHRQGVVAGGVRATPPTPQPPPTIPKAVRRMELQMTERVRPGRLLRPDGGDGGVQGNSGCGRRGLLPNEGGLLLERLDPLLDQGVAREAGPPLEQIADRRVDGVAMQPAGESGAIHCFA